MELGAVVDHQGRVTLRRYAGGGTRDDSQQRRSWRRLDQLEGIERDRHRRVDHGQRDSMSVISPALMGWTICRRDFRA